MGSLLINREWSTRDHSEISVVSKTVVDSVLDVTVLKLIQAIWHKSKSKTDYCLRQDGNFFVITLITLAGCKSSKDDISDDSAKIISAQPTFAMRTCVSTVCVQSGEEHMYYSASESPRCFAVYLWECITGFPIIKAFTFGGTLLS